jgi:hypothetical protein
MSYASIDSIRTYHANKYRSRFTSRKCCGSRSCTDTLLKIWDLSSSSLSLYQNSSTSRQRSNDSRAQEGIHRKIDIRYYRTNSFEGAAKRKEYQRYSYRSAAIFYGKEVIRCISAINLYLMWCLSINLTGFKKANLPGSMKH